MKIKHAFLGVSGEFDTDTGRLVCVPQPKNAEAILCFWESMNIPFARIRLHSHDRLTDAKAVFADAVTLGKEIASRWNAGPGVTQSPLVERARIFATAAHAAVGQRRKYTNEPYIRHPQEVAEVVRTVPHTDEMLAAALLHDTVEDTQVSIETIAGEFGPAVADLVSWLTDVSKPEDGNRAVRKAKDLAHTAQAPAAAQTVKLADLICNTASIVEHDRQFARVYLREKAALLEVLTRGDRALWERANRVLLDGIEKLALNRGGVLKPSRNTVF